MTTDGTPGVLGLERANAILDGARARAREKGLRPLTLVVVDAHGHLVAAQREDGASMARFDIAFGKACSAVAFGGSSRAISRRAKENPTFFGSLAATSGGRFIPQQGAALIRTQDGAILGAAGASGDTGDEDEACCAAGVESIGLVPDVSA